MEHMDSSEQFSQQFSGEAEGQEIEHSVEPTINITKGDQPSGEQSTAGRERRPRKSAKARESGQQHEHVGEPVSVSAVRSEPVTTVEGLAAVGFSADEVASLLDVTQRVANSREVREEQAIVRRLNFQRWLIEHGRLDEYAAGDEMPLDGSGEDVSGGPFA